MHHYNMKRKILFRVDGGLKIGLGHLVRCIALAQMLLDQYQISFICKEVPTAIESKIRDLGYHFLKVENEEQFLNQLESNAIVIMDHYGLNSNYQKTIKDLGCKLVSIDDLNDKVFYADLIINHAPNVDKSTYRVQHYTKFALGIEYALLRPTFLSKAKEQRKIEEVKTIFICFGGADPRNLTIEILKVACRLNELHIIVVTGNSYRYINELSKMVSKHEQVSHYHNIDEIEMARLMGFSDIAIVPASGILFEALASGCIVITSYYVDNQKAIFDGFKKLKAANFLEDFEMLTSDFLNEFILKFQPNDIQNPIDGQSNIRLKKLIDQL